MRFLLFLINPFISGINSLINIKEKNALIFLYLWFIIFGISFVAKNEAVDSYRYVEMFKEGSLTWNQYILELEEYFTFDSNIKDIYTLSVNYFVKSFTDNYHWTMFIYAVVFGFFYIMSLKYLVPFLSKTSVSYILLFLFCFSNPIFNINGVRFWTAAWIGIFALFKIFVDKKYQYYLLLAITPLIHGSFFIWIILVVIAQIVPKIRKVWIVLFILSMFVSLGSELTQVSNYTYLLPSFMSRMFDHYTTDEELLATYTMEALPLYARILKTLPSIMLTVLTLIMAINRDNTDNKDKYNSLFNTYLVLATLINFASVIPTIGARFAKVIIPILVLAWAKYASEHKKYNAVLYWIPIAYSYAILHWLRNMISVTELELYLFPAPATIIKYLFMS